MGSAGNQLIYAAIVSLDGYIADRDGNFDWAEPGEEAHAFINDLEKPVGTYLYGCRMYETMIGWETDPTLAEQSPLMREFAQIWQAAEKIVYSRTLTHVSTARTRIEPEFNPAVVGELKATAAADLTVSGPGLATHAFRAGLVDELQVYLVPTVVGGGTRYLPDDVRLSLELRDERRFGDGMMHLRYGVHH